MIVSRQTGEQVMHTSMVMTDKFTYIKNTKTLVSDISDLYGPAASPPFRIMVKSTKTGRSVVFDRWDVVRNKEGDIEAWRYRAIKNDIFDGEIMLFND